MPRNICALSKIPIVSIIHNLLPSSCSVLCPPLLHKPALQALAMGRVRTKVSGDTIANDIGRLTVQNSDGEEVGESHHRTILPQTHSRF
jgi:hypothetical protein